MSTDTPRTRAGRPVGKRGGDTRGRMLDAISAEIESGPGWRLMSIPRMADAAGAAPTTFYAYFKPLEQAVFELARRQVAAGSAFSPRFVAVLDLLAVEGWREAKLLLAEIAEKVENPRELQS